MCQSMKGIEQNKIITRNKHMKSLAPVIKQNKTLKSFVCQNKLKVCFNALWIPI